MNKLNISTGSTVRWKAIQDFPVGTLPQLLKNAVLCVKASSEKYLVLIVPSESVINSQESDEMNYAFSKALAEVDTHSFQSKECKLNRHYLDRFSSVYG